MIRKCTAENENTSVVYAPKELILFTMTFFKLTFCFDEILELNCYSILLLFLIIILITVDCSH